MSGSKHSNLHRNRLVRCSGCKSTFALQDLHCLFTRRNVYYASYRSLGFPIIELFLDKETDVAKQNVNNVQFVDTSRCIC